MPIQKLFDKENKRVGFEWDSFMQEHGSNWDEFTDEARQKACELAEKQGERAKAIWARVTG